MRVYEFAKELNKDSGDLLEELNGNFGFEIKSHLSGINEEQMEQVRLAYSHKKDLSVQVEDSHAKDLEEKFNTGEGICADAPMENKKETDEWTLGSGDAIPPEIKLDEKAIKKLKEENEEAVKISIESARKATEEYAKTAKNIVENPDDWSNISEQKEPDAQIAEKTLLEVKETQSWWEKLLLWIQITKN
jgi:formylmethanofuran dehydrogenase subunit D